MWPLPTLPAGLEFAATMATTNGPVPVSSSTSPLPILKDIRVIAELPVPAAPTAQSFFCT
jgi:hypothetical protein